MVVHVPILQVPAFNVDAISLLVGNPVGKGPVKMIHCWVPCSMTSLAYENQHLFLAASRSAALLTLLFQGIQLWPVGLRLFRPEYRLCSLEVHSLWAWDKEEALTDDRSLEKTHSMPATPPLCWNFDYSVISFILQVFSSSYIAHSFIMGSYWKVCFLLTPYNFNQ